MRIRTHAQSDRNRNDAGAQYNLVTSEIYLNKMDSYPWN